MTICRDVVTTLLQDGSCNAESVLHCVVPVPHSQDTLPEMVAASTFVSRCV